MSLAANCTKECTTPQHGYVEQGRDVVVELPAWDPKKFSYLKHFKQKNRAINPQLTTDEGRTAVAAKAAEKAGKAMPLGVAAPVVVEEAPLVKKLSAMTPEELDNVGPTALVAVGKMHGVELDESTNRADLLMAAMEAEDNSDLFE